MSPIAHCEPIDFLVMKQERGRTLVHCEGAQKVFGYTRAQRIARALGAGWGVYRRGVLQGEGDATDPETSEA